VDGNIDIDHGLFTRMGAKLAEIITFKFQDQNNCTYLHVVVHHCSNHGSRKQGKRPSNIKVQKGYESVEGKRYNTYILVFRAAKLY
jgi:hypothetical protein